MPFVHELLNYRSVAVVGMEKNCGKTECLNYIIRRMPLDGRRVCVTSIGLDGEPNCTLLPKIAAMPKMVLPVLSNPKKRPAVRPKQ